VLDACLAGAPWPEAALRALIESGDGREFFSVVVEGLSDRFEPRLVNTYAALMSHVIAALLPAYNAADLVARYNRVRRPRRFSGDAAEVVVLSRVTLGADVAVTSVILDAAKKRFPRARILLAGGAKSAALFAADPRIGHLPVAYGRAATLRERLAACPDLDAPGRIVIDPDSRLTQLGLVPVCREENYYFFESRSYGGDADEPLRDLARRWAAQTFGVAGARPYVAPSDAPSLLEGPYVAVSLGVGENPAKRVPDPFEARLLAGLVEFGTTLVVDTGAGGEERERVRRAAGGRPQVHLYEGSFAGFASVIARSRLYIGYDSSGQHVAAACGVPLVTVFAGFPCDRFLARWRPNGVVIRHEGAATLARVLEAAGRFVQ
jgi:ADP-heptose:LPS heptosyltransferase